MRTSKRPTAPTCIRTRTTCGTPGNGRWVPRTRRMGEPGTPRQRARQRQRQDAVLAHAPLRRLAALEYVRRNRAFVALTEAGQAALVRMGGVTDADVVEMAGDPTPASGSRSRLHLRILPPPFRSAAKAHLQA